MRRNSAVADAMYLGQFVSFYIQSYLRGSAASGSKAPSTLKQPRLPPATSGLDLCVSPSSSPKKKKDS